ncbi:hypothetical protein FACS1894211_14910 [Clostridia bacterium]|nr:hypothetical protein FACS1894211_14910 [Clostridia bacterium]
MNTKRQVKREGADAPFFYGGQAVLEGVMMLGKSGVALAVREEAGGVAVECKRKSQKKTPFVYKWPIIRGCVGFINSMVTGIKMLSRSAEAAGGEDEKGGGKGAIGLALFLGLGLFVGLFILAPSWIAGLLRIWIGLPDSDVVWQNVLESAVRIVIFILYLVLVSLMKDIRRTFMYHGAEHKTINCFEKGGEMTVAGIQKYSKRHNRCGTTFLFFVIIISILVFSVVTYALYRLGVTASAVGGSFVFALVKTGVRLALLPLVAGLSYELLRLLAKGGDNLFMRIVRAPGLALQGLTTREPEPAMIEVALAAFNAARDMDLNPNAPDRVFDLSADFQKFHKEWQGKAAERGAESASVDFLLCGLLNVRRAELAALKAIKGSQKSNAENLLNKLVYNAEPYQYLLGYTEFYGLRIGVTREVLIPRLDTEVLADTAVRFLQSSFQLSIKILDLCCGSGCIGAAVAKNTGAACDFADISGAALTIAGENAKAAGIGYEIVQSDLFAGLAGRRYDAVLCNPPYVKTADLDALPPDVKKEPRIALDGGADGLDFYRRIAPELREHLNGGARAYFEVGDGQTADVRGIFEGAGFQIETIQDLNGKERVVEVKTEN